MVLSLAGRGLLARKSGVKAVLLLGGSGTGLLVAGIVLILVLAIGLGDGAQTPTTTPGDGGCPIGADLHRGGVRPGKHHLRQRVLQLHRDDRNPDPGLHPTARRRLHQPQLPPRRPGHHGRPARRRVLRGHGRRGRIWMRRR